MEILLTKITVSDLVEGYEDDGDDGVRGFSGRLDIRPPYQRAFVYGEKERKAVIDTVIKGYPLNVMYWSVREDGTYEIIDGQQRTISIAQFVEGDFSIDYSSYGQYFHNLPSNIQQEIMDYQLRVYFCSGTDDDKLEWYKTINIAGMVLTEQELRNAVFAGPWVSDAKRYFSRRGGPAYQVGGDYLRGNPIRQDYLETVLRWKSEGAIDDYMGQHKDHNSAQPLWEYFRSVIDWIEATFTNRASNRKKLMKGLDWGRFYNKHRHKSLNPDKVEETIAELILDDEVKRKQGIYEYILTGEEKHLNLQAFELGMKHKVYEQQAGICANCNEHFGIDAMEADHITPWSKGGKTVEENCQMLCRKCNREKSNK